MSFYEKYLMLCDKNKKTPSGAALEMGLSKTTVNRWKNGGGITDATTLKVASYFGIPKEELTGEEQKEKPSTPETVSLSGLSPEDAELVQKILNASEAKKNAIRALL
jgi:transcriptional regulator with XRE-family HTH domain